MNIVKKWVIIYVQNKCEVEEMTEKFGVTFKGKTQHIFITRDEAFECANGYIKQCKNCEIDVYYSDPTIPMRKYFRDAEIEDWVLSPAP